MTTNCRFVSTLFEHSSFFSRAIVNVIILCILGGTLVNTYCDDL
jgi:hypothetical protein